jgi:NADH-quinone oxidoreductase subunit G
VDDISKSSELCITGRGHDAVLTLFPGRRLNNPYSGCTTDVCPVGALTLKEFRFQQRVWFLKKVESVCDGCGRGCSITMEHNHNRVWRYMPRENPELNRMWICDEGRLSFRKHRENRLETGRMKQRSMNPAKILDEIAGLLAPLGRGEVGALASPWAALEDNWMLQKLFEKRFDPRDVAASILGGWDAGDDILRLPEKYPNGAGLKLLGIPTDPTSVLKGMESGRLKAVLLMENDVIEYGGEKFQLALAKVPLVILLTPHRTAGTELVSAVVPVRSHAEKDGTFVNAAGRLQRFRAAVEPADPTVSASSLFLSALAGRLGTEGLDYPDTASVFNALAGECKALSGLTFETLPSTGKPLAMETSCPAPFRNTPVDFNVVMPPGDRP